MFRKIEDFIGAWAYETEITVKLFNCLTDEKLDQKITPDGRSLGFLAWHLALTPGEMLGKVGLQIDSPAEDAPQPASASEIAATFEKSAKSVSDALPKNWTDKTLLQEDDMYGEVWKRGQTLMYLMLHHAHHRGQMIVLMRQAGLKVVGIYGPAKEEWAEFGMDALP